MNRAHSASSLPRLLLPMRGRVKMGGQKRLEAVNGNKPAGRTAGRGRKAFASNPIKARKEGKSATRRVNFFDVILGRHPYPSPSGGCTNARIVTDPS